MAVPFDGLSRMLPQTSAAEPLRQTLGRFETSPITGIHLWFDRQITDLEHAVLLDRTIQWMFHKSKLLVSEAGVADTGSSDGPTNGRAGRPPDSRRDAGATETNSYVELVVSSSKNLVDKSKNEIVDMALAELREFVPGARAANLLKSTVIKEVHATLFTSSRNRELSTATRDRVASRLSCRRLDCDGWPATMEGAVRSGYAAAQCVARVAGRRDAAFLVPDLPPPDSCDSSVNPAEVSAIASFVPVLGQSL